MTISNALTKSFGNNYKNYPGDIGLEIETETTEEYKVPKFSFWTVHADGSLRGFGQEYVLKQPLDFEKAFPEALKEFKDKTKHIPFVKDSITTSVHVHLNMLNDNFVTLGNFLTAYSFVENILIRFSGDDRLSNLFCLPICDAEETYQNIMRMMQALPKKQYGRLQFEPDNTKYGALNLSSLVRYGSLEVRSFRGTTDIDLIHTWVGVLYSILRYSRQKELTPPQIIAAYKEKGIEILSDIFGEYRKIIRHKEEDKLLDDNLWYAVNIACGAVKDWTKIDEIPNAKKPKLKDLDEIAAKSFGVINFEALTHEQQVTVLAIAEETVNPREPREDATARYTLGAGLRTNPFRDTVATNATIRVERDRGYDTLFRADWDEDREQLVTWEGRNYYLLGDQMLVQWHDNGEINIMHQED